jgi:hypothetical protein
MAAKPLARHSRQLITVIRGGVRVAAVESNLRSRLDGV